MRSFNLKHGTAVPHPANEDRTNPGRTMDPEPMRMAEPGWIAARSGSGGSASTGIRNWTGESVQRREALRTQPVRGTGENEEVTDEERDAAREWLRHVRLGGLGGARLGTGD